MRPFPTARTTAWSTGWWTGSTSSSAVACTPASAARTAPRPCTWFANRTKLLQKSGPVEMKIANVQRRTVSANVVETRFDQIYTSKDLNDKAQKVLTWKRRGAEWYIVKESTKR